MPVGTASPGRQRVPEALLFTGGSDFHTEPLGPGPAGGPARAGR